MRTFDYSALRSRQWDSKILELVAQIDEFKGRQEAELANQSRNIWEPLSVTVSKASVNL